MTISIDSNVIAALWNNFDLGNRAAVKTLGRACAQDKLVVVGPVYSELMAGPLRDEAALDDFFTRTDIEVDWAIGEDAWREAGRAYRGYARRRIRSGGHPPRRSLADFVIGAHAVTRNYSLLTLDTQHYEAAFPKLHILRFNL